MMLETSLQSVGEIINESLFVGGRKWKNCFFKYLIEDWMSSAVVVKYLLKALATVIGSVKVALLSVMALGDVWFELFSEIMLFIPFHVFFRSLILKFSKIGLFTSFK